MVSPEAEVGFAESVTLSLPVLLTLKYTVYTAERGPLATSTRENSVHVYIYF